MFENNNSSCGKGFVLGLSLIVASAIFGYFLKSSVEVFKYGEKRTAIHCIGVAENMVDAVTGSFAFTLNLNDRDQNMLALKMQEAQKIMQEYIAMNKLEPYSGLTTSSWTAVIDANNASLGNMYKAEVKVDFYNLPVAQLKELQVQLGVLCSKYTVLVGGNIGQGEYSTGESAEIKKILLPLAMQDAYRCAKDILGDKKDKKINITKVRQGRLETEYASYKTIQRVKMVVELEGYVTE